MKSSLALLASSISIVFLNGCAGGMQSVPLASQLGSSSAVPQQPEVWVDKSGYQPNYQELTECTVQSKMVAKQLTGEPGKKVLDIIANGFQQSMEEDTQKDNCMLSKGYVKIKVNPNQMPPQKPNPVNSYNPNMNNGYNPNMNNGYNPNMNNGYNPNMNNGYNPNMNNGYNPNMNNGYNPNMNNGYNPNMNNGYNPNMNNGYNSNTNQKKNNKKY